MSGAMTKNPDTGVVSNDPEKCGRILDVRNVLSL
ncbi:hypothetical protein [Desulforamulus putei]|nr:hypothetical protein [Desulforamulus putei]